MNEKVLALNVFITLLKDFDFEKIKAIYDNNLWQNWFLDANENTLKLLNEYKINYEDLASDYTSLFISDIYYVKAPQSSSFYLDDKRQIYSEYSEEIKKVYFNNNFYNFYDELFADSLVNELLFIKYLLENNNEKALKDFLNNHFFKWFYAWAKDMQNGAKCDFYKALALLMQEFFNDFRI